MSTKFSTPEKAQHFAAFCSRCDIHYTRFKSIPDDPILEMFKKSFPDRRHEMFKIDGPKGRVEIVVSHRHWFFKILRRGFYCWIVQDGVLHRL